MSFYDNTDRRELDQDETAGFILAGNATFTLRSVKTGARYTYKVRAKTKDGKFEGRYYVSVLTGSDNETSFTWLGTVFANREDRFYLSRKSRVGKNAPSVKALEWAWPRLINGTVPEALEVWHEGRCGACNLKLTVPESIAAGYGPTCITRIAA